MYTTGADIQVFIAWYNQTGVSMSCKSARCLTTICLAYKETLLVIFTLRHGHQLHQWQPLMEKVIETPLTESISISFPWMGWYSMIHLHLAYFPTIIKVLRDVLQLFLRIVFEDFRIRSCSIANRVHLNVIFKIPSRILAAHQDGLDPVLGYSVHISLFVS